MPWEKIFCTLSSRPCHWNFEVYFWIQSEHSEYTKIWEMTSLPFSSCCWLVSFFFQWLYENNDVYRHSFSLELFLNKTAMVDMHNINNIMYLLTYANTAQTMRPAITMVTAAGMTVPSKSPTAWEWSKWRKWNVHMNIKKLSQYKICAYIESPTWHSQ